MSAHPASCPYCKTRQWFSRRRKGLVIASSVAGSGAAFFMMPAASAGPVSLAIIGVGTLFLMKTG